ncbi:hypothetical protein MNB_SM-7-1324 [hydrothermal vent metagenome]|uniref:Uncharacterized protein n=1 Tax=hydrothermal vent metagenome TaxID=652676 RepID=A0A1W1BXS9_9ZZZZ
MKIEITPKTAKALSKLYHRYFFGLFEPIRVHKDEEFELRDALMETVDEIEKEKNKSSP